MFKSKTLSLVQVGLVACTMLSSVIGESTVGLKLDTDIEVRKSVLLESSDATTIGSHLLVLQDTTTTGEENTSATNDTTTPATEEAPTSPEGEASQPEEPKTEVKEEEKKQPKKYYNILSLDGGGIRGIIPAMVIKYIEVESYRYALEKGYPVTNSKGKMAIKDLFNMVAGTSTGGLLTTGLVTPTKDNRQEAYDADFIISIFEKDGPNIFRKQTINTGLLGIMIATFIMIGGVFGYKWGKGIFANPKVEDTIYKMKKYIRDLKKKAKAHEEGTADKEKSVEPPTSSLLMKKMESAFQEKISLHFSEISNGSKIEQLIESDDYWKIKEGERMLQEFEGKYREGKQKKWIICVIGLILGGLIGYYLPVTVFFLGNSNYDRNVIDGILKEKFGHVGINDILTDDALVVSYSYNAQEPRFYSKFEANRNPKVYNVTMDVAAGATSAAPGYFDPRIYENGNGEREVLVDGGIIANNPSMYAFIFASEFKKQKNIRVISIGTGQTILPKIDPKKVSLFTWVMNLGNLIVDVEVQTHDYFTDFLSDSYKRFQVQTDLPLDAADGDSIQALKELGSQLVENEKESLNQMIHQMVDEKFSE